MLIDLTQQATISWKSPVYWTDRMLQCSQKQKGEHHHGTYSWDYFQRVSPSLQYRGRLQSRVVFPMGFFFSMGKDDWDQPVIGQYGSSDNGSISCSTVNTSPKCFLIACAIASRATPHNLTRRLSQDFCPNSKFGKRRNTVCTCKGYAASVSQLVLATAAQYFSFFKLKKWGKKTAETRRHNCAVLP